MEKVYIKDKQGNKVLPKTHVSAVYDDEGNDLGSHLGAFEDEVRGLVDTPHQEYVTVATYASLPASGSKDTIYRVSNYNGSTSQIDTTSYSEYAWDGSQYIFLCVKSQIDEVFDITVYNNNTKYADLAAALGTNGANIPQSLRKGGMSVKFVQSSDNKYVQYRLMANAFSTTVEDWQGVDDEPTTGSNNLVKSDGISEKITSVSNEVFINSGEYNLSSFAIRLGGAYDRNTGNWNPANGWRSYTIPVEGITKLIFKNTILSASGCPCFNALPLSSSTYVSGALYQTINGESVLDIPEGSKYVAIGIIEASDAGYESFVINKVTENSLPVSLRGTKENYYLNNQLVEEAGEGIAINTYRLLKSSGYIKYVARMGAALYGAFYGSNNSVLSSFNGVNVASGISINGWFEIPTGATMLKLSYSMSYGCEVYFDGDKHIGTETLAEVQNISPQKPVISYDVVMDTIYNRATGEATTNNNSRSYIINVEGYDEMNLLGVSDNYQGLGLASFTDTPVGTSTYNGMAVKRLFNGHPIFSIPYGSKYVALTVYEPEDTNFYEWSIVLKKNEKKQALFGKKIVAIGASITIGNYVPAAHTVIIVPPYTKVAADMLGMKYQNLAQGGISLLQAYDKIANLDQDADIIMIGADAANNSAQLSSYQGQLGTPWITNGTTRTLNDDTTICGTLNVIISALKQKYPNKFIFITTITNSVIGYDVAYTHGIYTEDINEAIFKIASFHNIPVFDIAREGCINSYDSEQFELYYNGYDYETGEHNDRSHFNEAGHIRVGKSLVGWLKRYYEMIV